MKKSRRLFQWALLAVALGLTVVFIAGLWRGKSPQGERPALEESAESQAEMKLTDMEYVEIQEGRHLWTLRADEADYFQDQQKTLLKRVRLTLFLADGREVFLESDQGMLYAGTKDIELWDSVSARLPEGYRLATDRAAYHHQGQTIASSSGIHLTGPDVDLKGKEWEYRIQENRGTVAGGVKASILPVHRHSQ